MCGNAGNSVVWAMNTRQVLPLSQDCQTIRKRLLLPGCKRISLTICCVMCARSYLTWNETAARNHSRKIPALYWNETGEKRNTNKPLVEKLEGRRLFGIRGVNGRVTWKCVVVGWTHFVQNRDQWRVLANIWINSCALQNAGHFLISWATIGFSTIIICV